ncbi:telomere-protecting terminal protein Tpg [Streptomyces sp. NPDC101776]|uniref:telomere-protecting terminal protein Tpg n=1 Tax=Streptomyces sp. NPDC101776 TaxID=3366146 RepID=UPI00380BD935
MAVLMDDQHDSQQLAPRGGKVLDALTRAERKTATRPAPKSAKAQMKFLLTHAEGSTKALAERLGVSRRTVQCYRAGQQTKPQKKLRAALVEETATEWQPQVRAQAWERAATSSGMVVEVYASFGFTCSGSSDDGRERFISTPIPPVYVKEILRLQKTIATERTSIRSSPTLSPSHISRNVAHAWRDSEQISYTSGR